MDSDLKIIKKKYGEEMAHFCRDAFATILEQEGVLANLLLKWFEPSKFLYKDLQEEDLELAFKDFIYKQFDQKHEEKTDSNIKTPQELLSEAGYDLYECKSEEDIQSFKKYYAPREELCTFRGGRLDKCYVFFAVKKNVDTIKREDFKNPKRQDLYGTSVISIQFDRNEYHCLSIKNRYNHTVDYCDSTFSNNLDNIIEGLTDSFAMHYGLKQSFVNRFEIPQYIKDNNGKYYKYNYEIDNTYYCPNNIILKQHEPIRLPKERYILADYFVIDMKENTISNYTNNEDSFLNIKNNPIKNISVDAKTNSKIIKLETMK